MRSLCRDLPGASHPSTCPPAHFRQRHRTLDKRACASGAERIGIKPFLLNLRRLILSRPSSSTHNAIDHVYWKEFWQSINSKLGAFAACFECFYVCPPGAKDFKKIIRIPYRREDIPPGSIRKQVFDEMLEIAHLGVPAERRSEYERDLDFGLGPDP